MPLEALRAPDDRLRMLPGFPWSPAHIEDLPGYEGLRMARIDEGPADAEHTFLCIHGEPTWCYLYRKMIPVFLEAGARVVVPDLFGFGRSDKPTRDAGYTFDFHRDSLLRLVERLELQRTTLVCQDWGGILGLSLPPDLPGRFARTFWGEEFDGPSFMAVGLRDAVLGEPVMRELRGQIRGWPEPTLVPEAGHFAQEYGEPVARAALTHFESAG